MDGSGLRKEIAVLESKVEQYRKQLEAVRRTPAHHAQGALPAEFVKTQGANERLREENADLREQIEDLNAMVEELKGKVSGRTGLVGSPRVGSPLSPTRPYAF